VKLLVDENLPEAERFFAEFGVLTRVAGRAVTPAQAQAADVLLLRSQTRIDAALLGEAQPRFVGTGTAGVDHVDEAFLAGRGIPFAHAPGCNADPVADWVMVATAQAVLAGALAEGARFAVVGGGAVGGRVAKRLAALGFEVGIYDPPRQAQGLPLAAPAWSREAVLDSDAITFHVPAIKDGAHPTVPWLSAEALLALPRGRVLLNAGRGGVVPDGALLTALQRGDGHWVALDVFEAEPAPSLALLEAVALATPHIAGHSDEGKLRGTAMLYDALCETLGRSREDHYSAALAPPPDARIVPGTTRQAGWEALAEALELRALSARYREALAAGNQTPSAIFDALRRAQGGRRDFALTPYRATGEAGHLLAAAGLAVAGNHG
jgi:erythronate-4-phosphate dehydrogenase